MRVVDLLTEHSLQLRLQTPSSEARLRWEVSGSAPTELIDPTPFLLPDTLIVVSGIAMNFQDERTWDAYVERLAAIPVSAIAFSTGLAHRILPKGLVQACIAHDVPLLEIPSAIPPLQLDRHVENVLRAERIALSAQGWELADECARLANQGAELVTLLASMHRVVGAPLAIYDAFGSVLAKYPEISSWPTGTAQRPTIGTTRIALPMGLQDPCSLEIRGLDPSLPITSILGPASSIIALHLNKSVVVDASRHHEIRNFVETCSAWDESSQTDVSKAFKLLELDVNQPTVLMVADMRGEFASTSWQLRVLLHDLFHQVRVTEIDSTLFAFAQLEKMNFEEASKRLLSVEKRQPLLLNSPIDSLEELRLSVVQLKHELARTTNPSVAPALGLDALLSVASGRGALAAASRFLAPLNAKNDTKASTLLETLQCYLENDAQPSKTCQALFIHRNSLNYRLRKIESLLGIDLSKLEDLSRCLLALRLAA